MKKVAVVILNYNGFHFIEKFLPKLIECTPASAEIIIADNCSTDHSVEHIQKSFPHIRLIHLAENYGFAEGYNRALAQVDAEYYAIINSDIEVSPNWLEPLIQFLDSNPEYAAVQPKIRAYSNKEFFEYAGAAGGFIDTLGYPFCRGRIFNSIEMDHGQYDSLIEVEWCSGACFVIRSGDYKAQKGFDESFFAHMEEIDLCVRLSRSGRRLACNPHSLVYHVGGGTLNQSSPFKTYLNFRNGLFLLLKNASPFKLIWLFPIRIFLDLLAGILLWKQFSFLHLTHIMKAHVSVAKSLITILKRREKLNGWGFNSFQLPLIVSFFLLNRKKFSQLPKD